MRSAFPKLHHLSVRARATSNNALPTSASTSNASGILRRHGLFSAVALVAGAAPIMSASAGGEMNTAKNGLQWVDELEGSGPAPVKGARIKAHYTGRLSNGKVFDSSYSRGQPLAFAVGTGMVIQGWDLGIIGSQAEEVPPMREGGKRKLIIPPALGYGSRSVGGGLIPPNSTLEFDVELVKAR
ncbi:hypothetical protein DUNSADRAFT_10932 [Dunaliella salina]|uniref:peptidylprolyl isomerase n=1 Tax=Dunaliella salina TaxID=3046 RepID=A0ABQ7GEH5_DUNSA|nr:hypothetical protein DUNSADRAFT_10932 [Dunaliella salina]|eukprot:KAF5833011.1 hypothetical protein DUNSADRAFT_10932 [Dunaliella salina]